MSFFGNSDEEARLASLERLFKMGFLTKEDYLGNVKKVKGPLGVQSANALDIIQLGLLAGIVGAVVYGVKLIK